MPCKCTRGEVFKVRLDPAEAGEINKTRPCVILQNDVGNKFSPNTIVAAITGAEHGLVERCGQLSPDTMKKIDVALKISLGLK